MKTPIYLDNFATTAVDPRVLEAMLPVFTENFGNPASQTHRYGWYAQELMQIAREQLASLINASPEEIIFTGGSTEATNLALKGYARFCRAKDPESTAHLISQVTEHPAVLDSLTQLQRAGFLIELLPVDTDGLVAVEKLRAALRPETILVSIMLANNEIGTIQDIKNLQATIGDHPNVLFHCDATQGVGKIEVDVKALEVDLLSLSAHKFYGPKGVGALYVRKRTPRIRLEPLVTGGGQERGMRSGTPNVPAIVGLGKTAAIAQEEMHQTREHVSRLSQMLLDGLTSQLDGIEVNGSPEHRIPGNLNLWIKDIDSDALIAETRSKISISASSACSSEGFVGSHVLFALGADLGRQHSSIRIGIGKFNNEEEIQFTIETLVDAVKKIRARIKKRKEGGGAVNKLP